MLDVKQPPNAQSAFHPIPGLIGYAGVTGSVGITHHACATQMAGLRSSYNVNRFPNRFNTFTRALNRFRKPFTCKWAYSQEVGSL